MSDKTIVINLFGGPGAGKTNAMWLMGSIMKSGNVSVDIAPEYVKEAVYEGNHQRLKNQVYILAKMYKKIKDAANYGVKFVVTDCPMSLGQFYVPAEASYRDPYMLLMENLNEEFENLNIYLNRKHPYVTEGRLQNEEESEEIGRRIIEKIDFDHFVDSDQESVMKFAKQIIERHT